VKDPVCRLQLQDKGIGLGGSEPANPTAVSDYREFEPPPALKRYLVCLWTQSVSQLQGAYLDRVLPDGCLDIVFVNDDPPTVVGPWTRSFVAQLAPGTNILGIRFLPGRATAFLRLPASEVLNESVPLSSLGNNAARAACNQIGPDSCPSARRQRLEAALLEVLGSVQPVDRSMMAAIAWLARHPRGRIQELSQWLGLSNRHLQRRFAATVGYRPKVFQSVLRFQRLVSLSNRASNRLNLAARSWEAGYADQAHMTREVRCFSGIQPSGGAKRYQ
jgi:AraC-like DNA-binding protein